MSSWEEVGNKHYTDVPNFDTKPIFTPDRGRNNFPIWEISDSTSNQTVTEGEKPNRDRIFAVLSVLALVSFLFCLTIRRKLTNQVHQISNNSPMTSHNFSQLHESQAVLLQQDRFHVRREQCATVNDLVEIQI